MLRPPAALPSALFKDPSQLPSRPERIDKSDLSRNSHTIFPVGKSSRLNLHKLHPYSPCILVLPLSLQHFPLARDVPVMILVHLKRHGMRLQFTTRLLPLLVTTALFSGFGVAQQSTGTVALPLDSILDSMQKTQAGAHPQAAYQVIREYRIFGANSSDANSEVVAAVNFSPPSSKNYQIQTSSGNNRGQQVVRKVLDHEVESSTGDRSRSALTRDNYDFTYLGETLLDGQQCYLLGLKPKRKEKELISGQAWVDKNSFFVRHIEGEVAKTPSWWLKKVRVKLSFADFDGSWLQTSMEAVADVRMLGAHTLTSRLVDYRGADVVASHAGSGSTTFFGARAPKPRAH